MPHRNAFPVRAAAAAVLFLGATTGVSAADLIELMPGLTKIVTPERQVQALAIGNPTIADVRPVNLKTIAITGRRIGTTNVILFDESGDEIAETVVQVVAGTDLRDGADLRRRNEVRVRFPSPDNKNQRTGVTQSPAASLERTYLCASSNCSPVPLEGKEALAPGSSATNYSVRQITNDASGSQPGGVSTTITAPNE